jgi:hypothetical protein
MKRLLAIALRPSAAAVCPRTDLSRLQADLHRRALRGRRPDRPGGAPAWRGHAQGHGWQCATSWSRTRPVPVARSAPPRSRAPQPDGHTLLLFHIGMASTPALYRKIAYKPLEDFEFLGMVNEVPMTLIGKPQLPANTYRDFENYIRGQRRQAQHCACRPGFSASHLCSLMWQSAVNAKEAMTTIPYGGTAPAMNALLGGQVDLMCDQTTNTTSQIERPRQGLCRDHGQAAVQAQAAQGLPDAAGNGPQGLRADRSGTACTHPRARRRPCSRSSTTA